MHTYTVTATDGVSNVSKQVTANSRREAAGIAMDDDAAYTGFDDSATLTITVTQP
jgi:hypothetical protein